MQIISIFLLGACILAGALAVNMLASAIGLMSWYDFLKAPRSADALSYLWLFILYPLSLGVIAFAASKVLP